MARYRITKLFTGGFSKGLTYEEETNVEFKEGQKVDHPIGGSPYKIIKVVKLSNVMNERTMTRSQIEKAIKEGKMEVESGDYETTRPGTHITVRMIPSRKRVMIQVENAMRDPASEPRHNFTPNGELNKEKDSDSTAFKNGRLKARTEIANKCGGKFRNAAKMPTTSKSTVYKGYFMQPDRFGDEWYVSKDGSHICTCKSAEQCKKEIDNLV